MNKFLLFIYAIVLGVILSDVIDGYRCKNNDSIRIMFYGKISCELIKE